MLEHARHVIIALALCVSLYNAIKAIEALAAVRQRSRHLRAKTLTSPPVSRWLTLAALSAGVAWIVAGSQTWATPPSTWTDRLGNALEWLQRVQIPLVLMGCVGYFLIVLLTNTGVIGIPRYRLLQSRAQVLRSAIELSQLQSPDRRKLSAMISDAENTAALRIGPLVFTAPLTGLFRANRTMNAAEIQFLSLLSGEELSLRAQQIAIRLEATREDPKLLHSLRSKLLSTSAATDADIRADCVSAVATIHAAVDIPAEREAERIRVALWLTLVGLTAVLAHSAVFNHERVLLAGALGGLLGSLASLITRQTLSLELIIVSPVAGALNAVGGLLLIGFLASERVKLLGDTLRNVWSEPNSVEALALALLLGFSGGLFARLAITGGGYLLAPLGRPDPGQPVVRKVGTAARDQRPVSGDPKLNGDRAIPPSNPQDTAQNMAPAGSPGAHN